MNEGLMQAWFEFWTKAAKGGREAQAAFQKLMQAWPAGPADPAGLGAMFPGFGQQEKYREWLEEAWRAMGVVPRQRYLELLERNERLRQRLEEAEETIARLQGMVGAERQAEVGKMVDAWETAVKQTLKAQSEWLRLWAPPDSGESAAET